MSGPWIKVEYATPDKTEVRDISKSLGIHRLHAFGLCVEFWRWCDAHLKNGHIHKWTVADVDDCVHHTGFGRALADAGWLQLEADRLIVTNFQNHLGQSAKNRNASKRQAKKREKT